MHRTPVPTFVITAARIDEAPMAQDHPIAPTFGEVRSLVQTTTINFTHLLELLETLHREQLRACDDYLRQLATRARWVQTPVQLLRNSNPKLSRRPRAEMAKLLYHHKRAWLLDNAIHGYITDVWLPRTVRVMHAHVPLETSIEELVDAWRPVSKEIRNIPWSGDPTAARDALESLFTQTAWIHLVSYPRGSDIRARLQSLIRANDARYNLPHYRSHDREEALRQAILKNDVEIRQPPPELVVEEASPYWREIAAQIPEDRPHRYAEIYRQTAAIVIPKRKQWYADQREWRAKERLRRFEEIDLYVVQSIISQVVRGRLLYGRRF